MWTILLFEIDSVLGDIGICVDCFPVDGLSPDEVGKFSSMNGLWSQNGTASCQIGRDTSENYLGLSEITK